jgi:hypothetical protein
MKRDEKIATYFLGILAIYSIIDYWLIYDVGLAIGLGMLMGLASLFLLVAFLINGIIAFRELKLRAIVPLLITIIAFVITVKAKDVHIKLDWILNHDNRIAAIQYINQCDSFEFRERIPADIGYVSKYNNEVLISGSKDRLTVKFLIDKGFLAGAYPDLYFKYTSDRFLPMNGSIIELLEPHWSIESISN